MSHVEWAKKELELAGLFDKDSDYEGMIGEACFEIIKVFSKQGHSGFSASFTLSILEKLLRWQNLTPLTENPDEWNEVGTDLWQSSRNPSVFSKDGGKTHYDLDDYNDD